MLILSMQKYRPLYLDVDASITLKVREIYSDHILYEIDLPHALSHFRRRMLRKILLDNWENLFDKPSTSKEVLYDAM